MTMKKIISTILQIIGIILLIPILIFFIFIGGISFCLLVCCSWLCSDHNDSFKDFMRGSN